MKLLLIRHGETDSNAGQLALGRADVPLNERGRLQAQALARRCRVDGLFGSVAAIYASPLQRTVATATPIADALGLEVQVDPALIEMDIGEVEGLSFVAVRERYAGFVGRWLSEDVAAAEMPGGESLNQVQERAWAAVDALLARHADETVAAVTHNFVILTLLCRALDLPLARFRRLRQDLAGISILELTPERQTVVSINDTAHLRIEG